MARGSRLRPVLVWLCLLLLGAGITLLPASAARQLQPGNERENHGSGQAQIPGLPGVATRSSVINLAELCRQQTLAPAFPEVPHPPHHHPPVPGEMPVPDEIQVAPTQEPEAANVVSESLIPSPAPGSSFRALDDNNTAIPPDTHGAVGPNHLMVVHNSQVRIQNRGGGVICTLPLYAFWASLGPFNFNNTSVFDPRVLYDPDSNRWVFTAGADNVSVTSRVLVGVTQTSNPMGNWNLYSIEADPAHLVWADFPGIGFNKDSVDPKTVP